MKDEENKTIKKNYLIIVWIFVIIVGIAIAVYYLYYLPQKESANPVVTFVSNDPNSLKNNLINTESKVLGSSGYSKAGLRQPCIEVDHQETLPNLPKNYNNQICETGLVCVKGIVKGGGICLLNRGSDCSSVFDCTPTTRCINGICQERNELINQRCVSSRECMNENFKHICYNSQCKYDIYPKDQGCENDDQCNLNESTDFNVRCLKGVSRDITTKIRNIDVGGKFSLTDEDFNIPLLQGKFSEVTIRSTTGQEGNFSIINIDFEKREIFVEEVSGGDDLEFITNDMYDLSKKEKNSGICIVEYPLGSEPKNIEYSDQKYPCESGLKLLNNICVEGSREGDEGDVGQVCVLDKLKCSKNLECIFNREINESLINNFYQDLSPDDVGKCFEPSLNQFINCSTNESDFQCKKPFICGFNNFCINTQKIMNPEKVIGCPSNSEFKNGSCKVKENNLCLKNTDCFNDNSLCNKLKIQKYSSENSKFSNIDENFNFNSKSKILMSKNYISNTNTPTSIGHYYENNGGVKSEIKLNTNDQFYKFNIQFEKQPVDTRLDIFEKQDNSQILNISYIQEYEKYRLRKYEIVWCDVDGDGDGVHNPPNNYIKIPFDYAIQQGSEMFVSSDDNDNFYKIGNLDYSEGVSYPDNFWVFREFNGTSWFNIHDDIKPTHILTFSQNYNIYGDETGNDKYLTFVNGSEISSSGIDEVSEFLNWGDKVTYNLNNSSGVSAYYSLTENFKLEDGTSYFTVLGTDKKLFLVENYDSINTDLYIKGTSISTGNFEYSITDDNQNSPYLSLDKIYGLNILSLNISDFTPGSDEENVITIKEKFNFLETGDTSGVLGYPICYRNSPIGYFSGVSKFTKLNVEIDENNILVSNKFLPDTNQCLNISYDVSNTRPTEFDNDYYSMNTYTHNGIDNYNVFKYQIENTFSVPDPKIYGNNLKYLNNFETGVEVPYELDRVQNYINTEVSTVDVFSNFKNIKPSGFNTSVAMENKMRKVSFSDDSGLNLNFIVGDEVKLELEYNGVDKSADENKDVFEKDNNTFGFCSPIELSKFKIITNSDENSNTFNYQNFIIVIKNQKDIDAFLKYGSSELVIVFYNEGKIITARSVSGIQSYTIDNETLKETLSLYINEAFEEIETSVDDSIEKSTPYLFPNNIFPMSVDGSILTDGSILVSSCLNLVETDNRTKSKYHKSFYNKMTNFKIVSNGNNYLMNVRNLKTGTTLTPGLENPYFNTKEDNNFNLEINGMTAINETVYLLNNLFLSTIPKTFEGFNFNNYSNLVRFNRNYVLGNNFRGDFLLKTDTIPFYTGTQVNKALLDQTFKSNIKWNLQDLNFNIGDLNFQKMIFNFNPGNVEDEMNYYAFVRINETNILYYLSVNRFSVYNRPLPIILKSEENLEETMKIYSENSFMTPYDDCLYVIGKICTP